MEISAEPFVDFRSENGHYTADACVVWCFDDRFYKLLKAFGKQEGWGHIDLVKVAGGAKALAADDGAPSSDRDFVLDQIKKSAMLHGTKRVVLMLHRDCGGYGGSKQFAGSDAEKAFFTDQLDRVRRFVRREFPGLAVEAVFADFDGLHRAA